MAPSPLQGAGPKLLSVIVFGPEDFFLNGHGCPENDMKVTS